MHRAATAGMLALVSRVAGPDTDSAATTVGAVAVDRGGHGDQAGLELLVRHRVAAAAHLGQVGRQASRLVIGLRGPAG